MYKNIYGFSCWGKLGPAHTLHYQLYSFTCNSLFSLYIEQELMCRWCFSHLHVDGVIILVLQALTLFVEALFKY